MGMRARDSESWVICHCGDAGWIAGQALNGFNAADIGNLPLTFVMQRNGIQLSDSNKNVMDKDPRPIVEAMGVEIIELKGQKEELENRYEDWEQRLSLLIEKFRSLSSPSTLITQASLDKDLLILFVISKPSIFFENEIFLPSDNVIAGIFYDNSINFLYSVKVV